MSRLIEVCHSIVSCLFSVFCRYEVLRQQALMAEREACDAHKALSGGCSQDQKSELEERLAAEGRRSVSELTRADALDAELCAYKARLSVSSSIFLEYILV